jgi:7,8-dihydropterin-6-yl-methyl-4-(beta-D-ribofuranosyl)aminobenzene 5'-phosphate synthase
MKGGNKMEKEEHQGVSRRDFVKGLAVGGAAGAIGAMGIYSYGPWRKRHFGKVTSKNIDIGECKGVKITNISETSWFDNKVLMGDIKGAGGLLVNQYEYNWPPFADVKGQLGKGSYEKGIQHIKQFLPDKLDKAWEFQKENAVHPDNAGCFACLIDVELLDGSRKKILLDSGWAYDWTDECFKREGIDKMLSKKEIDYLIISHEHFDHFWGLPVSLKYNPEIPLYVPDGFYQEGFKYIRDSGYRGKLTVVKPGLNPLFPGCATFVFAIPIICRVYGEQSLYFNVQGAGLVSVTGCCHQSIIQFAETARRTIKFEKLYGVYGGLHISPFEDWDPKYDDLVISLKAYGFEKIGCNHCTGIKTARKFIEAGYPVVKGTARFRSKDIAYLGNGDTIEFKAA